MKTRSLTFITIIVLSVFLICSISLNSQTIKKIEKLKVKKIEAVKSPLVLKATIGMILQDVGPVHIIEVNGQNMGEPQGNRKIFLGNQEGNVRNWYNNYIELSFPDSPVLGKRIPFVIKTGNIAISNTRLKSLRAYLEDCTPTSIRLGNIRGFLVTLKSLWCGTDKNNIKIRFMKKNVMVRPLLKKSTIFFGKIKSITRSGPYMDIKVVLPPQITAGKYLVHIMQERRIVSDGDPVYLTVLPRSRIQ